MEANCYRLILQSAPLGILAISPQGQLLASNALACKLLDLPDDEAERSAAFSKLIGTLDAGESREEGGDRLFEFSTGAGRRLEMRAKQSAKGIALFVEDVTARRQQERERHLAEDEYSSLFSNAVCGIYRDSLDGKPMRCNTALAQLNGYDSEKEFIAAVTARPGNWYVDPNRSTEFKRLMEENGGVKDFVSEAYRHRTHEKFWIMENAWYVRDRQGNPICIEGTIQDATERMMALDTIERQANIDALTGAASRFRFFNLLDSLTAPGSKGCTLFSIDLDHFKQINDHLGHEAGDIALQEAARRMKTLVQPGSGVLARIGGDEFAVVLSEPLDDGAAEAFARSIVEVMAVPVEVRGHSLPLGASVGTGIYPTHASCLDELLGNADKALYASKAKGRNGHTVFGQVMRAAANQRRQLTSELAEAIRSDGLELYYQPIVFSDTGMVEGCEALLRWNHPKRGMLPPIEFLPLAEEEGLMTEIGNWVLRRACHEAMALPAHVQVAVNISADQFRSPRIIETLRDALASSGLEPERLAVEITETVILSSETVAKRMLGRLSEMGISVALDDFGTAYSSLSYLQKFTFNKVKIDKSFVSGMFDIPADMAVVRAIIGIGRDLGIEIVAEGVENRMQMERLAREGCKRMQGYYFSKPKPFAEISNELALAQITPLIESGGPRRRLDRRG